MRRRALMVCTALVAASAAYAVDDRYASADTNLSRKMKTTGAVAGGPKVVAKENAGKTQQAVEHATGDHSDKQHEP